MRVVERFLETVVLLDLVVSAHAVADVGLVEDAGEVDALRLPVFAGFGGVEAFDVADHLVDGAEPEFGHDLAEFHGDERHEIHHVLGLAFEVLAQLGILSGDADRAGVFLTDAHHQATDGHEWCGGEAVFFSA